MEIQSSQYPHPQQDLPQQYHPQQYPPQYLPNVATIQPPPPAQAIVVTQQPTQFTEVAAPFGPNSRLILCPNCRASISTHVEVEPSTKTHLFALGLCLLGCWCCVCVPYCTDSCQSSNHYCPNCKALVGKYHD